MPDLDREQLRNAAIIYQVGAELGASPRDIQIALITALTESGLRNVNYGDRDSLGLFQQRAAWAPAEVRMDPYQSARMFFLGGQQGQRGLFAFKNRNQMGMGEAAQAVQVSAFPDRYAEFIPLVQNTWPTVQNAAGAEVTDMDGDPYGTRDKPQQDLLGAPDLSSLGASGNPMLAARNAPGLGVLSPLGEGTNQRLEGMLGASGQFGKGMDSWRTGVVEAGRNLIGTPYVWGGTTPDGGFDCSGFIQYVYNQMGLELPRISYQQANAGKRVGLGKLQPGDLVAWDNSSRNSGADHVAIYIGGGRILEAPQPGQSVRIRRLGETEGAWGVKLDF